MKSYNHILWNVALDITMNYQPWTDEVYRVRGGYIKNILFKQHIISKNYLIELDDFTLDVY